jgi:hypothetical protein
MRPTAGCPRTLLLALAGLLAGAAPAAARAEDGETPAAPTIYKWVDANGIAHYTTDLSRVPRSVRGSVRELGSEPPSEGYAGRDAAPEGAPAEEASPEPPPEWDVGDAPPPAPAPAPRAPAGGPDRWAETDRALDLPPDEAGAPAPTQTAAAEPPEGELKPSAAELASRRSDLEARIAALEAEIRADEDALKGVLSAPSAEDPAEIAYDRSFRDVAERLPKRLAELRSLQNERAQLDQQP